MSYLENMRARRRTPQAAWHVLRTALRTEKFDCFAVYEGEEDEDFYAPEVSKLSDQNFVKSIICDGKGGVLALRQNVLDQFPDAENIYYFIDADHDRILGIQEEDSRTFVTDGYSIESYALSKSFICDLLRYSFHLQKSDPLYLELEKITEFNVEYFCARARVAMTWIVCLRDADHDPKVDSIHFNDFFTFQNGAIGQKRVYCKGIHAKLGCETVSLAAYRSMRKRVRDISTAEIVRGKMVSQFIIALLKEIERCYVDRLKQNGKRLSCRFPVNKRNFFILLSERIETPKSLESFFVNMKEGRYGQLKQH